MAKHNGRSKLPGYQRRMGQERAHAKRAFALAYAGNECAQCGSKNRLELDHVDPKTKNPRLRGKRPNQKLRGLGWPELFAELDKLQTLCRDCHREKTRGELTP